MQSLQWTLSDPKHQLGVTTLIYARDPLLFSDEKLKHGFAFTFCGR